MSPNLFKAVIEVLIGVGTLIIMLLWTNKINTMEKELNHFYASDTTMVIEGDTIPRHFIINE